MPQRNKPPTEAPLVRLVTDPGDKPRSTPKLNRGTFEKPLGLIDSFAVVSANEAPVSKEMILRCDEIGPVIWHAFCPKLPHRKGLRPNGGR
jgi:hypothetical protein